MKVALLLCCLLLAVRYTQTSSASEYIDSNYNVTFAIYSYQVSSNSDLSPFYPYDRLRTATITSTYILVLDTNNILQLWYRSHPRYRAKAEISFRYILTYMFFIHATMNLNEQAIILTSHTNNHVQHFSYSWCNATNELIFQNVSGSVFTSQQPTLVTEKEGLVYTYFRNATNDTVYITNLENNNSWMISLPCAGCNVVIGSTREKAILWSRTDNQIFIHAVNSSFTLLHRFSSRLTPALNVSTNIAFNHDCTLAILEFDSIYPIVIFNLTDYSISKQIIVPAHYPQIPLRIYAATFLDKYNRFLLLLTNYGDKVMDLQVSDTTYYHMNMSFTSYNILVDFQMGVIYNNFGNAWVEFSINITAYNQTIVHFSPYLNIPDAIPIYNDTSQIPNDLLVGSPFYQNISYSSVQETALFYIDRMITTVNVIITNSFSLIFSSPFALLFLSSFNYFNLSSLYILLHIRVPYQIFNYFSQLFTSCQMNFIDKLQILPQLEPFSSEKVMNHRALYFGVTTDLLSKNYTNSIVFFLNILLVQLLIVLFKNINKMQECYKLLQKDRLNIYWGLMVSQMVTLVLPWTFSISRGAYHFIDKGTFIGHQLSIGFLFVLVVGTLFYEIKALIRESREHCLRIAMRRWWVSYQNLIYPLLVLLQNPIYFLVVIGLSQIAYLVNSFYVPHFKILAIIKALYPISFHACFVVFLTTEDEFFLSYATVTCLGVFLIGSLHILLETAFKMLRLLIKLIKKLCTNGSKNKVADIKRTNILKKGSRQVGTEELTTQTIKKQNLIWKVVGFKEMAQNMKEDEQAPKPKKRVKNKSTGRRKVKKTYSIPKKNRMEQQYQDSAENIKKINTTRTDSYSDEETVNVQNNRLQTNKSRKSRFNKIKSVKERAQNTTRLVITSKL